MSSYKGGEKGSNPKAYLQGSSLTNYKLINKKLSLQLQLSTSKKGVSMKEGNTVN
jgi:hypothetical protein